MKRWDFDLHEYVNYDIPKDWKCRCISNDLSEKINCASCGKELTFGESYTSCEIFDDSGFWGMNVCEECSRISLDKKFKEKR